ncbi:MAG: hypothetical protein H0W30_10780 [Gemmatimonadaceae bacterium]|nr:hypothetical protein [Gemmatimonadaceae bacterium]
MPMLRMLRRLLVLTAFAMVTVPALAAQLGDARSLAAIRGVVRDSASGARVFNPAPVEKLAFTEQDPLAADQTLAWVSGGLGRATGGVAGVLGVDALKRQHLISVRAVAVTTGNLFSPGDEYWDAALLYGRALQRPRSIITASSGLGVTGRKHREGLFGGPGTRAPTTISLPFAARASWRPLSFLGLGIYGFANVNKEKSFVGAATVIELGRLR